MKITFAKKNKGYLELGIIFGVITVVGLFVMRLASTYIMRLPPCTFHSITGIPCPSCGATRSAILLAQGELITSLKMNPLFSLLYISVLLWGLVSFILLFVRKKLSIALNYLEARIIRWGVLVIVLLNWIYLIFADSIGFNKI
jgi:hypothetical protein